MNKKLMALIPFFLLVLIPIGLISATSGQFSNFSGGGHGGCHGSTAASSTGSVILVTGPAKPNENFTITATIDSFTEAVGSNGVTLGFVDSMEDNSDFAFTPSQKDAVAIDGSGDSTAQIFTATAPSTPGLYIIEIEALMGDGGAQLEWASGKLTVAVTSDLPTSYISAANYLVSIAVSDSGGYKWEESEGSGTFKTGWNKGAAGIGGFLLEAYQESGDSTYLTYAEGAATWLWAIRHTEGNGTHWSVSNTDSKVPTSIYRGTAGIATFFLQLYDETGTTSYRDWAEEAAQYLFNENQATAPNELAWRLDDSLPYGQISHRWVFGTPGVGVFFMDLEAATGNATYGWWAQNVSNYLVNAADTGGTGASWTQHTNTANELAGYWHGAAGIGDFFLDVWEEYADATAYQYANLTFEWLDSVKVSTPDGYAWENVIGGGEIITGWSRGQAGLGTFLMRLADITGNATHLSAASQTFGWLIANATVDGAGYWWNDNYPGSEYPYVGRGHGMAGIGDAFIKAYDYTSNATYLGMIEGIYNWLIKTTLRSDNLDAANTNWAKSGLEDTAEHATIYYGTAGVGFFLLARANLLGDAIAPSAAMLATPSINGTSVTLEVTGAIDAGTGISGVVFYVNGSATYLTGILTTTITLAEGSYTVYAIVFDAVGNPLKISSQNFDITVDGGDGPPLGIPGFDLVIIISTLFGIVAIIAFLGKKRVNKKHFF